MPTPPSISVRAVRWLLLVAVLTLLAVAWWGGVFALMAEPQSFARAVVDLGGWGYAAFVLSYTLLQPFGVPGTVFVVAAPLLWPWPTAFALSMIGTMAASVVGFSFARFLARDWVSAHIPARFHRDDEALARHALRTVFALRLIFWMPQALHGFLGVSRVSFRDHFWGSLLGYIPPLLMVSYFAAEVFDASGNLQPRAFSLLGALLAGSLVLAWWLRRDALRTRPGG
jgi:uncharacterized membrane protein YdjX (TVP38/TMEM64 family)